jgi:hypothetical protein
VSKSDGAGSSGEEEEDWESPSVGTVSISASSWASGSAPGLQQGVVASGSACGTMGNEGGGERGRSWIDGCDVRGSSGSCGSGVGVQEGRVRGPDWGQAGVPAACDVSSDKGGSGTVCFGSESVGGGDG